MNDKRKCAMCATCGGGIYFAAGHWFHLIVPWDHPHAPAPTAIARKAGARV